MLLKSIEEGPRGKTLYISRADPGFLRALFELEIPEIVSGSVEIKAIAREAGSRSKIAVFSTVEGIDPIGSCVGQRGVRINAIMNELKMGNIEEKVDIILWDPEIEQFLSNALSPAQTVKVKIKNKDEKSAEIIVPDDQLSLAIGKDGQNVRLAAKLTGWKIDIQGETVKIDSSARESKEEKEAKAEKEAKEEKTEKKEKKEKKTKKVVKKTKKVAKKKAVKKTAVKKKAAKKATKKTAKK